MTKGWTEEAVINTADVRKAIASEGGLNNLHDWIVPRMCDLIDELRDPLVKDSYKEQTITKLGECVKPYKKNDPVNHPVHYTSHPSGVECIEITRHMGFNLGNAMKYLWRADLKGGIEDLRKALWYINDEIEKREKLPDPLV